MRKRITVILMLPIAILLWIIGWSLTFISDFGADAKVRHEKKNLRKVHADGVAEDSLTDGNFIVLPPEEAEIVD